MDGDIGIRVINPDHGHMDGQAAPESNPIVLQVKGVKFSANSGVNILSDVSFHIDPGELVALTGPSRSGKTILLHSLAGLLKPTDGEIAINGVSLYTNKKAFRTSIGFVPAEYALQQHLTVTETLIDASRLRLPRSTSHKDRQLRVQTLLQITGLTPTADARVKGLSKVDKRKLSIAVELSGYPGLLLLDEAADGLAPFEELQITTLLQELARLGLTIIQVNQLSQCVRLSDRVICLTPGGALAWFGPFEEAFAYLESFIPAGSAKDTFGLEEAIEMLVNPQLGNGSEWAYAF